MIAPFKYTFSFADSFKIKPGTKRKKLEQSSDHTTTFPEVGLRAPDRILQAVDFRTVYRVLLSLAF